MGDDTVKVFVNPEGSMDDIGNDLRNFLQYLADGTVSDEFTEDLSKEVDAVRNNKEWRREYMTLEMIKSESRAEGRREEVFSSVQDGDYSVERGAGKLDMTPSRFMEEMEKAGYKIPSMV